MTERNDMIAEATDLGLEFPGNISNVKLAAMLAEAKGQPPAVEETPPPGPAVKSEAPEQQFDEIVETVRRVPSARQQVQNLHAIRRQRIAVAKEKAMKKHIVTITNKDNRENDVMTTAYLSFENQHFGMARLVPLDIPVELETALIKIAASTTMTLHKDEIVNGQRTGNKVPTTVKKFAISYSSQKPN